MRRLRGYGSLVSFIAIAVAAFVFTLAIGNKPLLGLDLQGGVSVVLKPTTSVEESTLNQAITIIRQRVDALGVAEPEITRQGDNILIQIPGVKDKDRALDLVGQTAELQFRPVLGGQAVENPDASTTTTTAAADPSGADGTTTTVPEATTTTVADPSTSTTVPESTTTTENLPGGLPVNVCVEGLTPEQVNAQGQALLPQCKDKQTVATYQVGPVALTGAALDTARATLSSTQWVVNPVFKGGDQGIGLFNAIAGQCYSKASVCPTGQLAIVLDGRVLSAPVIQQASFSADQIEVSGSFTEGDAKDLATALRYGALPVEFEQQQAQIVSATLGKDALNAGIVAGIVGVILVGLYMIAFYRFLGVLAMVKLVFEGLLLWAVVSWLGTNNGLALTLAGITGIIVSIGVSLDSNVVYYEHMKEDVLKGRTVRSATDKSFTTAFSTIVKADVASLLGAALLWWLTVGPVRGFAFYLALSTILDLIGAWAYMRPAVRLATRSRWLMRHPRILGLPEQVDNDPKSTERVKEVVS